MTLCYCHVDGEATVTMETIALTAT